MCFGDLPGILQLPSSRFYQSNIRVCETVMSDDAGIYQVDFEVPLWGFGSRLVSKGIAVFNLLKAI